MDSGTKMTTDSRAMPTGEPGSPHSTAQAVEAPTAAKNEAIRMSVISPVPGIGHRPTTTGARMKHSRAVTAWTPARASSNGPTGARSASVPPPLRSRPHPSRLRIVPHSRPLRRVRRYPLSHTHSHTRRDPLALARTNVTIPAELLRAGRRAGRSPWAERVRGGRHRGARQAGATPSRPRSRPRASTSAHRSRWTVQTAYRWVRDLREDPADAERNEA